MKINSLQSFEIPYIGIQTPNKYTICNTNKFNKAIQINNIPACLLSLVMIVLSVLVMIIGFSLLIGYGIDRGIDNKNKMLCESAKVSGNERYTRLCNEYYVTGNIEYMRSIYE